MEDKNIRLYEGGRFDPGGNVGNNLGHQGSSQPNEKLKEFDNFAE